MWERKQGTLSYPALRPESEDETPPEATGDVFVGNMEHGVRQGPGKYTWSCGACFQGQYEQGRRQGQGTMTFPDNGRYTGGWNDNQPDGEGMYEFPSGDSYVGGWHQGKKHGAGTYHAAAQQSQYIGMWEEGRLMRGKWVQRDGSIFAGEFAESLPAHGTHFFSRSGLVQSGRYAGGCWQGASEPTAGSVDAVLSL